MNIMHILNIMHTHSSHEKDKITFLFLIHRFENVSYKRLRIHDPITYSSSILFSCFLISLSESVDY